VYTQLTSAPPSGYELMPDYVWCWGNQTKHDIEIDKSRVCQFHGDLVGGNPWLDRWLISDQSYDEVDALTGQSAGKKRVLVSLQHSETPLKALLVEAMMNAPPDWVWWLRVHPLRRHTIQEIQNLLRRSGVENYEIDLSTSMPLFALLDACDHHVTYFSSVAAEAMAFGKSTTLLTDVGRKIFAPYIKAGKFHIANTSQELISHVSEALQAGPVTQLDRPFIETGPNLAEEALATLIESRDHTAHD